MQRASEADAGARVREANAAAMQQTLPPGIERVLFSAADLDIAIREMAAEIAHDYADRSLVLIGVLKGAVFVTADLARAVAEVPGAPTDVQLDFITVSSYGNAHRSSGEVRLIQDTSHAIEGRHVVIVEDIIDNGHTLAYLRAKLGNRRPASLRAAVLLDMPRRVRRRVRAGLPGTLPDSPLPGKTAAGGPPRVSLATSSSRDVFNRETF
jgi:hypoxanthine phosphoribosyltransferase